VDDVTAEQIRGAACQLPTHYYDGHSATEWENSLGGGESPEDSRITELIVKTLRELDAAARGDG
jgi:hypothetical protein